MKNRLRFLIFLSLLSACFCTTLSALPDVFFQDSDAYNGAYLRHEFGDNFTKIRFIVTSPVSNIIIPNNFYDFDGLKNYIENIYQFNNQALKKEFVYMLRSSFESRFRAQEFLEELQKVLHGFSRS